MDWKKRLYLLAVVGSLSVPTEGPSVHHWRIPISLADWWLMKTLKHWWNKRRRKRFSAVTWTVTNPKSKDYTLQKFLRDRVASYQWCSSRGTCPCWGTPATRDSLGRRSRRRSSNSIRIYIFLCKVVQTVSKLIKLCAITLVNSFLLTVLK